MGPEIIAEHLPVLLGAGAGAAAKGAAGAAGKDVFERLRDRLRRDAPEQAEELDSIATRLESLAAEIASLAAADEEIGSLLAELQAGTQISLVRGAQTIVYGDIGKQAMGRDIGTLNM